MKQSILFLTIKLQKKNKKIITSIKSEIEIHGHLKEDFNLNRRVKEIIGYQLELQLMDLIEINQKVELNSKYELELSDVDRWYNYNFPLYFKDEHRRHVVYFNSSDYENRLQCISLFQIIDTTMVVYQRSGDIVKMLDDFRFFVEIKNRYFPATSTIIINYGSLHSKIIDHD